MSTVEELILRDLGKKKVRFAYPGVEGVLDGTLKDRCVLAAGSNIGGVPYWDVIDLIRFEGQSEPDFMRIGYFRKPLNRLVWGSQTTITEPLSTWKNLFVKAAQEKPWFRTLLEDVMSEVNTKQDQE
jgi:hypothetical protein